MRYCGIDLHSNNSVVVVTDEVDKVLLSRRCPNDLSKILALLAPHREELAGVVIESTYNWYWLVDGLIVEGYDVKLAHTVAMKRYDGLKTAATKPTPPTWRTCCGWASCPPATFIRLPSAPCAIWPGSASSSCARAPSMCWR